MSRIAERNALADDYSISHFASPNHTHLFTPNFGSYRELNPSILCNPLSHKYFCIKETLEEHLAQDAPRVFLCYKNTYAREDYIEYSGSIPGRNQKFGEGILSRLSHKNIGFEHYHLLGERARPKVGVDGPF